MEEAELSELAEDIRAHGLREPIVLDPEGRQHLVTILEGLSAQFGLVLLISHHDDLKDAFPSQILVTRGDDGLSQVEVRA